MAAQRKQVTFDLDTNALKVYYPSENWRYAYEIIKKHMCKCGFSWQQGSVYVSDKPMSARAVSSILTRLVQENPWLKSKIPSLWTRSYFCCTVGHISEDTIQKYIEGQKNK